MIAPHLREGGMKATDQDDSSYSACYQNFMGLIIAIALAVGFMVLLVVLGLRIKRHNAGSVPGRFDFDKYKEGELNRRGMLNRTNWGK